MDATIQSYLNNMQGQIPGLSGAGVATASPLIQASQARRSAFSDLALHQLRQNAERQNMLNALERKMSDLGVQEENASPLDYLGVGIGTAALMTGAGRPKRPGVTGPYSPDYMQYLNGLGYEVNP